MSRKIYFFHSKSSVDLFLKGPEKLTFIFFSPDYAQQQLWQRKIPSASFINFSFKLEEKANELKKDFSGLISDMGRQYNSPAWWASRISEKNTAVSSLFLYCCYLHILKDILNENNGSLGIIAEDWVLLKSMAEAARANGCRVVWRSRLLRFQFVFGVWSKVIGRFIKFILRNIVAKLAGSDFIIGKVNHKTILIHTYVDETGLREDGVFCDRYFPGLCDWLESAGYRVVTLPVLFNIKRSVRAAWLWFRNCGQHFINPYIYYGLSDYCFVIYQSWLQRKMPRGQIILRGLDVSTLFRGECERYLFGGLDTLLYARLPKRLNQSGFAPKQIIMPYENMSEEKLFIWGLREYLPKTRIVSYQHGAIYPLLLCNYISSDDSVFVPMPDKVVCNGELSYDILRQEGFPRERLVVGPALRYKHLWDCGENICLNKTIDILVPLSLMESETDELMMKILIAFSEANDLKVVLKPHPMKPICELLERPLFKNLPQHFKIIEGNMRELIFKSKVVIVMSSSSILESLAAGVPVIVVGRSSAINLNPLGFFQGFSRLFFEPTDILAEANRILSSASKEIEDYRVRWRNLLKYCFNETTETSMQVFLSI